MTGTAKQQNRLTLTCNALQQHVNCKLLGKGQDKVLVQGQDREQDRARAVVLDRGQVGMLAQVRVAKHRLLQVFV
jgi:hypothetical protein